MPAIAVAQPRRLGVEREDRRGAARGAGEQHRLIAQLAVHARGGEGRLTALQERQERGALQMTGFDEFARRRVGQCERLNGQIEKRFGSGRFGIKGGSRSLRQSLRARGARELPVRLLRALDRLC